MSFILDALKKAEAERQRQTGPTLLEVRVTQPRQQRRPCRRRRRLQWRRRRR